MTPTTTLAPALNTALTDQEAPDLSVDDSGQIMTSDELPMPALPTFDPAPASTDKTLPEPAVKAVDTSVISAGMYTGPKPSSDLTKVLMAQWTQTLKQNPIGETYLKNHEGISFTPRTLAVMQQRVEAELEQFKPLEDELEALPVSKVVHFTDATMDTETAYGPLNVPPTFEVLLTELCGPQQIGEAMWDQYSSTMSDPDSTLEDVKKMYIALYSESRIAPDKSYVMSAASILQDILDGRATQTAA